MTDEQKLREAFQRWAKSEGIFLGTYSDDEAYQGIEAPISWKAWQAALSHANATAEECEAVGEAVAWLEVEPGISFGRAVSEHGMLIHSMQVHVGRRKPTKRQDANGLFPLFGHPPRAARDARDAERYRHLRDAKDTRSFWIAHGEYGRMSRWNGEPADHAIDQAIAGKRGG